MKTFPPTVIVIHPREKRSKCSVEPLRGREDFIFHRFPEEYSRSLDGYVRLGIGGPVMSPADGDRGLLVLDGTWKLAAKMEPFYARVPVRSLPEIRTAYPRVSKVYDDPSGGLATIEAIYAAYRLLGRDTRGLLDDYYWAGSFLEVNSFSTGSPATPSDTTEDQLS